MSTTPLSSNKPISSGWFVLLFLIIAAVLAISNWPVISIQNLEVSDFAANSLLIQKAKSFSLFVGNYSRVGFNHPGPAILYVMAFGEFLFFDTLKLTSSPFSGQLLAVALYSAFWITLMLKLLSRLTGALTDAALITAVFLAVITFCDSPFLTGMWFPNLYMLPFTVMIISISTLFNGRTDSLQSLALSSGFLINGHVSFVAVLGITLVLTLIFNRIAFYKSDRESVITSKDYVVRNIKPIGLSVATLALFFVPLVIETMIHFPGPIVAYATFSGGHVPNTMRQALSYTLVYWGGILPALFGVAALIFANTRLPHAKYHWIRAISLTFIAATCAFLFYAKYGVDMLDQIYIGFFYYSVPALTAAVLFFFCSGWLSSATKRVVSIAAIVACVTVTYYNISKPPSYTNIYNQPNIAESYKALSDFNYPKRMVLDLDNGKAWGTVWSDILGIEMYGVRHGTSLFCIKKNWHISFTRDAMCTPDEVENNSRFFVTSNTPAAHGETQIAVTTPRLLFIKMVPPVVAGMGFQSINGHQDLFNRYILDYGWSLAEQDFVWSMGKLATLSIPVPEGFSGSVTLDLAAFIPSSKHNQHIEITQDDRVLATQAFDRSTARKKLTFEVNAGAHKMIYLKINIKNPISPKELGQSDDQRKLGVALYGMQVGAE
ncbi:MAG: hypothetical protein PW845_02325 [Pseudomonas sp.]|uniref:hypothetical protein n=1 Tax=Pseudomonas abieticivorans TaxID=2931382 RepID=UPI0020C17452|nr:hypothetical protein [Pseudomonas sp. PIA16]MDE1164230.1 hypothetical protein [Pseudomonas sp.]